MTEQDESREGSACRHLNVHRVVLAARRPCFADVVARQRQLIAEGMRPHGRGGGWDEAYDEVKAWGSRCLCAIDECDSCLSIRWCGPRGEWMPDDPARYRASLDSLGTEADQ